jgi:hypothetical protein
MNPIVQNVIGGARRQPGGAESYRAVNPAKLDDVVAEYAFSSASDIAASRGRGGTPPPSRAARPSRRPVCCFAHGPRSSAP